VPKKRKSFKLEALVARGDFETPDLRGYDPAILTNWELLAFI